MKKISIFLYKLIYRILMLVYPTMTPEGTEHLPKEPAIYVGNHAQLHGPICCELFFPVSRYTWCAGEMMTLKEVPAYAFQDFWSEKPKRNRWFFKLLSYLIAPLSVIIFCNAKTIPVYHDTRVISTFKTTLKKLQDGESIVIFPEKAEDYNHILCQFQDRFIDTAKLYYRKTGKELEFVPMYLCPSLHKMCFGQPIRFCGTAPIESERIRICKHLMDEITRIAGELPKHVVTPYKNLPKNQYPTNIL